MSTIETINNEINAELANESVARALLATTFKGLSAPVMKRALMEGMMRNFTFKDFLEKNIYALPFKESYSLVTSIDYARKVGMRSGIVGVSAPIYEMDDKKILACSVTVKRKIEDHIGEYTATVYFDEYYKAGRNGYPSLWDSKPRTMIAKVAEMHALRKACPEELSQSYVEEEMEKEIKVEPNIDLTSHEEALRATTNMDELKQVWSAIPIQAKQALEAIKTELKTKYENA